MPRTTRTILTAAAAALALSPALAAAADAPSSDPASFPARELLPMRLDVTPNLSLGGSAITLRIRAVATGNQGFERDVNVIACVGAAGCKTGRINVRRPGATLVLAGYPLTDIRQPGFRVGLQVMGCTVGFRCASVVRTAVAR